MQENPISNQPTEIGAVEPLNTTRASSRSSLRYGPLRYAVVDVEIGLTDHRIHDIGALRYDGAIFHKASKEELLHFLERGGVPLRTQHHPPRCQIPLRGSTDSLAAGRHALPLAPALSRTSLSSACKG